MNIPEIAKCPNKECGRPCSINESRDTDAWEMWVDCCTKDYAGCGYSGPRADVPTMGHGPAQREAIRLHNAICRQPTPEAADKPKAELWAIKWRGEYEPYTHDNEAGARRRAKEVGGYVIPMYREPPVVIPAAHPPKPEPTEATMTDAQIKHMVDRFLEWRLPENFTPDAGISFKPTFNDHFPVPMKHEPIGTNLFDAAQAMGMVRYMIEGLPDNE